MTASPTASSTSGEVHSRYIVAYRPVRLIAPGPPRPRKPRKTKSRDQLLRERIKRAEKPGTEGTQLINAR